MKHIILTKSSVSCCNRSSIERETASIGVEKVNKTEIMANFAKIITKGEKKRAIILTLGVLVPVTY